MNVSLVREIDYWVGIPVCFFLTGINFLFKFLTRKAPIVPKKFLFIELSEMGSAILAYPTMKRIKELYPGAELFFLIFEKNRESVDILNIMPSENVLVISDKSLLSFFRDVLRNFLRMRKEKIDVTFDLELFSRATAILTYLSGASKRVGFYKYRMEGLYRGRLLSHKIQYNFQQHISESFLSFVQTLKYPVKNSPTMDGKALNKKIELPVYNTSPERSANIWKKLIEASPRINKKNKIIILNPGGGEIPIRAWSAANYINLAKKILANPNNYIILTGVKRDGEVTGDIQLALGSDRCVNFAEKTSFRELLDLFNIADILITNDSGPAHFASLTPIKNFVFFGPETPTLYSPLGQNTKIIYSNFSCSPCLSAFNHRSTECKDNKCLQLISADEVYNMLNL